MWAAYRTSWALCLTESATRLLLDGLDAELSGSAMTMDGLLAGDYEAKVAESGEPNLWAGYGGERVRG